MGRIDYLTMKTDEETAALLDSDFNELKVAAKKLINHATTLVASLLALLSSDGSPPLLPCQFFLCSSSLLIISYFAFRHVIFFNSFMVLILDFDLKIQFYLLILDRTNWRTNMLTALLIPYIFFSFPAVLFNFFRGEVGKWIALIAVVLRLFFPRHFPDWLEMPGSLILLLVVSPSFFAHTLRDHWVGVAICLVIGCYLLQEHIRASGGFRNSFTRSHGISNTVGIILLLVFPIWALLTRVL
ncbi:UNVERIFIED_CONTAM: cold-regulated plasma membrane protein 2 [Sesamum calycinum]|uniref:Cold-regulated plasma membrane protein 2 n=1 Tax=Sesamum calycinum TaxID=2727403 RepID=A0AAW2MNG8_9LAMI